MCQIRAGVCSVKVGTVWNTLKGNGTEKRGGETKISKRGGSKLGPRVGALKKVGLEPPYELWSSLLPENLGKLEVFWRFQGIYKRLCSGIFIINFEIILQLLPEFQLLPSNMKMFVEMKINQPVRNTCFLSSWNFLEKNVANLFMMICKSQMVSFIYHPYFVT